MVGFYLVESREIFDLSLRFVGVLAMTLKYWRCDFSRTHCVIARGASLEAINRLRTLNTVDCRAS